MVIPAKRDGLACAVTGLIGMGMLVTGHRRQRRERAALKEAKVVIDRL